MSEADAEIALWMYMTGRFCLKIESSPNHIQREIFMYGVGRAYMAVVDAIADPVEPTFRATNGCLELLADAVEQAGHRENV